MTTTRKQPGRKPKHGARGLSAAIRANRLDRRSWLARFIAATEAALADDFGGFAALCNLELLKVQHAAALWAEMQALFAFRQRALLEGRSDPETAKYAIALANAVGRALDALGTPKREPDLPSLQQYLQQRPASKPQEAAQDARPIEIDADTNHAPRGAAGPAESPATGHREGAA